MLDYMRENPMRRPDWIWQRAMGAMNGTQVGPSRRIDGNDGYNLIRRAIHFKNEIDTMQTERDQMQLARLRPDMYWAYRLYSEDIVEQRYDVEARILARCNDWEIGFATGFHVGAIAMFSKIFFDVRDRLQHRSYILHVILGGAIQRGLSEREYDLLWKLYGYFYGPHVLDAVISKCVNPAWCPSAEGASGAIQADVIGTMKLKASIAAKTIRMDSVTQMELLHAFNKFVEIERTTESTDRANDVVLTHLTAMMNQLTFNVGGRNPRDNHRNVVLNPVHSFDNSAIELSYEETMKVTFGESLPNAAGLRMLTFPQQDVPEAELAGGDE